jgi:hypothetical protein
MFLLFPAVESVLAIRAPVFGFRFSEALVELEESVADLAANLLTLFAVIVVEVFGRCLTIGAGC